MDEPIEQYRPLVPPGGWIHSMFDPCDCCWFPDGIQRQPEPEEDDD